MDKVKKSVLIEMISDIENEVFLDYLYTLVEEFCKDNDQKKTEKEPKA